MLGSIQTTLSSFGNYLWEMAMSWSWWAWAFISVFLVLSIEIRYWFWKRKERKFIRGVVGKMVKNVEETLGPLDELKYHTERRMDLFKIIRYLVLGLAITGLMIIMGNKAAESLSLGKPLASSARKPRKTAYEADLFLPSRMREGSITIDGKNAIVLQRSVGIVSIFVRQKASPTRIVVLDSSGRYDCVTTVRITEDGQDIWPCDQAVFAGK